MNFRKLASGSFWLIMFIHVVVFASIGIFTTRGWGLLVLFLSILVPSLFVLWLLTLYIKRYAGRQRFATFLSTVLNKKAE